MASLTPDAYEVLEAFQEAVKLGNAELRIVVKDGVLDTCWMTNKRDLSRVRAARQRERASASPEPKRR